MFKVGDKVRAVYNCWSGGKRSTTEYRPRYGLMVGDVLTITVISAIYNVAQYGNRPYAQSFRCEATSNTSALTTWHSSWFELVPTPKEIINDFLTGKLSVKEFSSFIRGLQ